MAKASNKNVGHPIVSKTTNEQRQEIGEQLVKKNSELLRLIRKGDVEKLKKVMTELEKLKNDLLVLKDQD